MVQISASPVETVPEPPDGYLRSFLTRDEIEVHLLMPQGQTVPPAPWSELLDKPILHTVNFTTVAEADRFADAAEFHITTKSEEEQGLVGGAVLPGLPAVRRADRSGERLHPDPR